MKKGLSLLLVFSLIISLAAVLGACGKGETEETTTETTEKNDGWKDLLNEMSEEFLQSDDVTYTEHSTDENYSEDYEALTLPTAKTTKAATTTQAPKRETTTKSAMFTTPTTKGTTKKGETTKAPVVTTKATTKPGATTESSTMTEISTDAPIKVTDAKEIPTPNVTYLDKYVKNILKGTSYTARTEMHADGMSVPISYAISEGKSAVKMTITSLFAGEAGVPEFLSKAGEIKLIDDGKKFIMSFPTGYTVLEGAEIEEFREIFNDAQGSQDVSSMLQFDRLKYCGLKNHNTYVTETYIDEEDGATYIFYFNNTGLAQWEIYDKDTGEKMETVVINLKPGADADFFKYSGKKYSMEEMEKLFGDFA